MKTIVWGRSRCEFCQHRLSANDLAPIISFAVLSGRCRYCKKRIPHRLFFAELAAFLIIAASIQIIGVQKAIASLPLAWMLFALAYFDIRFGRLPDALTLTGCALGIVVGPFFFGPVADHGIGALVGWGVSSLIATGYRRARGHNGLGGGDIKLLAAAGAWAGWQLVFPIILGASIAALAFAVVTGRTKPTSALRFGPFISAATWGAWCWQLTGYGTGQ